MCHGLQCKNLFTFEGHSLKSLKATALMTQANPPHLAATDTHFPSPCTSPITWLSQLLSRIPCSLQRKWKHSLRNLAPLNKYWVPLWESLVMI